MEDKTNNNKEEIRKESIDKVRFFKDDIPFANLSGELKEAMWLARRAGEEILTIRKRQFSTHRKKDSSIVTEADLASEKILIEGLKMYSHEIRSEEGGGDIQYRKEGEKTWILDPLDGTNDFVQGNDEFCIMIGLVSKGVPIGGVVYQPTKDKIYFAEKGKGAFVKEAKEAPQQLHVSKTLDCSSAHFLISRTHNVEQETEFLAYAHVVKTSRAGSLGIKLGLISQGNADGYIHVGDKTYQWDTAAPQIILEEAGGKITDRNGDPLSYNSKQFQNQHGVFATNGYIHEELVSAFAVFSNK